MKKLLIIPIAITAVMFTMIQITAPQNPCAPLLGFLDADGIIEPANIKKVHEGSDVIAVGKITKTYTKCDGLELNTHMQVQIEKYLKNPQETTILSFKTRGGYSGNYAIKVENAILFEVGDRAILFLKKANQDYDVIYPSQKLASTIIADKNLLAGFQIRAEPEFIQIRQGQTKQ